MIVLGSWAVGLVIGGVALGLGRPSASGSCSSSPARILGCGLGGVQVADRVLMVRLSPPERIGEFFGSTGWSARARRSSASCCTA